MLQYRKTACNFNCLRLYYFNVCTAAAAVTVFWCNTIKQTNKQQLIGIIKTLMENKNLNKYDDDDDDQRPDHPTREKEHRLISKNNNKNNSRGR